MGEQTGKPATEEEFEAMLNAAQSGKQLETKADPWDEAVDRMNSDETDVDPEKLAGVQIRAILARLRASEDNKIGGLTLAEFSNIVNQDGSSKADMLTKLERKIGLLVETEE